MNYFEIKKRPIIMAIIGRYIECSVQRIEEILFYFNPNRLVNKQNFIRVLIYAVICHIIGCLHVVL